MGGCWCELCTRFFFSCLTVTEDGGRVLCGRPGGLLRYGGVSFWVPLWLIYRYRYLFFIFQFFITLFLCVCVWTLVSPTLSSKCYISQLLQQDLVQLCTLSPCEYPLDAVERRGRRTLCESQFSLKDSLVGLGKRIQRDKLGDKRPYPLRIPLAQSPPPLLLIFKDFMLFFKR